VWDIIHEFYSAFGFNLRVRLSLHDPANPEKYLGGIEQWHMAESMLREIVAEKKADSFEGVGEAAFYGPKLDFMAADSIGREWQVATIQLDMVQPERFDLTCTNEKGEKERIVMIHAAIMGSIDRFLSIAIEHFAGTFPTWLSPVQIQLILVSQKFAEGGKKILSELEEQNLRVELDESDETVGNKVRKAAAQKAPYIVVVGEKELAGGEWMIRVRGQEEQLRMTKENFIQKIQQEILQKNLQLISSND
jgi:threonyl-tRNA synthetase